MGQISGLDVAVAVDEEGRMVVRLAGELDMDTAPWLRLALEQMMGVGDNAEIILDLAHLRFLDCSGMSAMILGVRLASARNRVMRARNAHGTVEEMLRVTGVDELLRLPAMPMVRPEIAGA